MYYRPTQIEVETVLSRVIKRYPQLTSRATKAKDILLQNCLEFNKEQNQWRCWSLTDPRHSYHIAAGCTCPDHQKRDCPQIRGRKYCKHRIAALAYKRILQDHLNARICGNAASPVCQAKARKHSNTLVLLDSEISHAVAYKSQLDKIPTDICAIRWTNTDTYDFHSDEDAGSFARWLDTALYIKDDTYIILRLAGFSHEQALSAAEEKDTNGFIFPNPIALTPARASA